MLFFLNYNIKFINRKKMNVKMEIILGETAGFCYGVKRAVEGAEETIKNNKQNVYCLGEIVHNKEVIEDLENKGIVFVEDINEAKETIIIRAHGVTKETYKKLEKKNINVKDYTCPFVIKIHKIAEEYAKAGFYIFLTGSKKHPENIGTMSFCGNNYFVIETENDVENAITSFNKSKKKKILLISQTTYSNERFNIIQEKIQSSVDKNIDIVVKNTICTSTQIRQKETETIAKQVNCMIVIGGKNSSNTKKLYEIACKYCKNSICIEKKEELNLANIENYNKIGIMAGASTPQKSIDNVISIIKNNETNKLTLN